jgi:hypothetical protein
LQSAKSADSVITVFNGERVVPSKRKPEKPPDRINSVSKVLVAGK